MTVEREGLSATVRGGARLRGAEVTVPGDASSAAFLVVAALVLPDSEVRLDGVLLSPTRTAFVEVLRAMGGRVEERGARGVAGDGDLGPPQPRAAPDGRREALALDRHAERRQHPLGVVAARDRLADGRRAVGLEPGEEDGRLHLRARHREVVGEAEQPAALDRQRGLAVGGEDGRAHRPQRHGHAIDGPAAERLVAREHRRNGRPARAPASMRIVEPEFSASRTATGGARPRRLPPRSSPRVPSRRTSTPRPRRQASVEAQSAAEE